jgi:hypothetical protein
MYDRPTGCLFVDCIRSTDSPQAGGTRRERRRVRQIKKLGTNRSRRFAF